MIELRIVREEDRAELLRFLAQQFPDHENLATESFFTWRYKQNPLIQRHDQPSVLVACQREHIVGCMGAIADRLWDGQAWHHCQWLVNLIVAPEFRGGLEALRLFEHAVARCPLTLTTGAGPHMLRLYQTLGWRQLAICDTLYFPLRPAGLLRMARDTGRAPSWMRWALPIVSLAGLAWRPVATVACKRGHIPASVTDLDYPQHPESLTAAHSSRHARPATLDPRPPTRHSQLLTLDPRPPTLDPSGPLRLRRIERFDDRIDLLIERLLPALAVTSFRSADYLNWKFVDRPCGRHFLWHLEDGASGELRGYAAAKLMHRPGVAKWLELCDYLIHPDADQAWRTVVGLVCRTALGERCDFIRMRLSIPQHAATLRRPFWMHKRLPVSDDVFLYSPDCQLVDRLASFPRHLTAIVSDRCDYGRDEVS